MNEKKDIFWRAYLIYFGFVVLMIVVIGNTIALQLGDGEGVFMSSSNGSEKMPTRSVQKMPRKGEILDADYNPLVTSVSFFDVHMDPTVVDKEIFDRDISKLCKGIHHLYPDKTAREYENLIRKARANKRRYLPIRKMVTSEERNKLRTLPIFKLGRLGGGLIDNEETIVRKRTHGELMKRTLGYVKSEDDGALRKVGIEGAYYDFLNGEPGEEIEQKITTGWKKIGQITKEAVEGADVVTTFDVEVQEVAHTELLKQLEYQGAESGCVIVMDVQTGYVKAMVNLSRAKDGKYYESFNKAIGTKEVPGSTFKLASLMSGLEDGKFSISDKVNAPGKYTFFGSTLKDSREWGYGEITIQEAFEKSSNVFSKIMYDSYRRNPSQLIDRLKTFKLDQKLGISLAGEAQPTIPQPGSSTWSKISLPWMSIGYEVEQTPLQTLAFYNAVANDGKFVRPLFVKEIRRGNELVKTFEPEVIVEKICSDKTLNDVKKCLKGVVRRGTGKALQSAYFDIAGKTGTAVTKNASEAKDKEYQASFVGYFPADDPIYSCIVVIAAPTEDIYGAVVSGTVFNSIANKVYASSLEYHEQINLAKNLTHQIPVSADGNRYDLIQSYKNLNIPFNAMTDKPWVNTVTGEEKVSITERYFNKKTVPNVIGMTAKDAVFLIESTGMAAKIIGQGRVNKQSMPAGTTVFIGGLIEIELE